MNAKSRPVSVIMPVFNGGRFLPIALKTVASQDYGDLDIIAVDDGSTDESPEVLASFSKSWPGPMKVVTHPGGRKMGIAASYRLGLEHCQAEYVAFLEQDDAWQINKVSVQTKVFESFPEVGMVFSDVYTCDDEGRVAPSSFQALLNKTPKERPFRAFRRMLWGNCVSTFSNIMVRRNLVDGSADIIMEPEGFQDWMLLLLLSQRCCFYHSSQTKTFWRRRANSYHAKLRRLPGYRRRRKLALRNAIERILAERQASGAAWRSPEHFQRVHWHIVTSLMCAAEGLADSIQQRIPRRKRKARSA